MARALLARSRLDGLFSREHLAAKLGGCPGHGHSHVLACHRVSVAPCSSSPAREVGPTLLDAQYNFLCRSRKTGSLSLAHQHINLAFGAYRKGNPCVLRPGILKLSQTPNPLACRSAECRMKCIVATLTLI